MARVIIEDALKKVTGHFELVLVAAERSKQILEGNRTKIAKKSPKTHVTALREIEEEVASVPLLKEFISNRVNNVRSANTSQTNSATSPSIIEELENSTFIEGELEVINTVEGEL